MKKILPSLAIVFAAGIPGAIAASFAGVAVPAVLGAGSFAIGFAAVVAAQLLLHDYATMTRPRLVATVAKASLPLAA